ncbi:MAG: methyl-accepting chemotaxis protein [Acetobacteraceae bacterium]|nr:methyl-accepting chemotaxis protein [Acetobacteraceae bacterium]
MRALIRPFLNLSVGWKLGLSAALSLGLMAALVLLLRGGLASLADAKDAEARTLSALATLVDGAGRGREAVASTVSIGTAQAIEAVDQALAATIASARGAERQVRAAAAEARGEPARAAAAALAEPLAGMVRDAERLAEIRRAVIQARDNDFLPASQDYDQAFEAAAAGLEFEIEGTEAREEVRHRLMSFHQAMNELRVGTLRYLATGDAQAARRLRGAMAQARIHLRAAASAGSERHRADVARLGQVSERIAAATVAILDGMAAARLVTDQSLLPLLRQIGTLMQEAEQAFLAEREAEAARAAAEVARADQTLLGLGAGLAVLLLLSAVAVSASVATPLRRIAARIVALEAGDAAAPVPDTGRRDEIGAIAGALEGLRGRVAEAFERQQMIEQLPTGIMTADPSDGFRIRYVNPAARELIRTVEASLPVRADEVVGQPIALFHRDGGRHHEAILSDPARLPHRARIRIGGEVMDLMVSALRGPDGRYLGPMVAWSRVTAQARLADRFESEVGAVIEGLAAEASRVEAAARRLSAAAAESGREAATVAEAAQGASAEVQAVAAAAEEMAASVAEISRRVAEAAAVAGRAVEEARSTDGTVQGLAEEAGRIGDVVRLIGDIAGQTNLLALNATIEAARAGDAGKGFAVVASEVKSLAAQTAKATEEIAARIAGMQDRTQQAVEAIRAIGATIQQTSEIATAIAAAVEQQGAVTRDIARSAGQVAQGTDTVSRRIGGIRQGAADTGEAAVGLLTASEGLSRGAETLRAQAGSFLAAVRSA